MTIKLIENLPTGLLPKKSDGSPITLCDNEAENFTHAQLRGERDIEFSDLSNYFSRFVSERDKLPSEADRFKKNLQLFANFAIDDISRIIIQNVSDIRFLRAYMGINDEGAYVLCIAPLNKRKEPILNEGTIYSIQCCGYPPHS